MTAPEPPGPDLDETLEPAGRQLGVNSREEESRPRERAPGKDLGRPRRFAVTLPKRRRIKDSLRRSMIRRKANPAFLAEGLTLRRY